MRTRPPPRPTPPRPRPTTAAAVAWGGRRERGTTPPLGLGRLRDDLECSRGTANGRGNALTRPERRAARRRHGPPHRGEGRLRDTAKRHRRSIRRVTETPTPPTPQGTGQGSEVGPDSAPLPPPTRHSQRGRTGEGTRGDRKSTRLNSSHANISYAVFCLKKKKRHSLHLPSTTD